MWEDEAFGHYVVGQADADSCFCIVVSHSKTYPYGIAVLPLWAIAKTADDEILEKVKEFLGVGKIQIVKKPSRDKRRPYSKFVVKGSECGILVNFFERFPLRANKRKDFEIWKGAVDLYLSRKRVGGHPDAEIRRASKRCWTKEELIGMLKLRKQLSQIPSRIKRRIDSVTERELQRLENIV